MWLEGDGQVRGARKRRLAGGDESADAESGRREGRTGRKAARPARVLPAGEVAAAPNGLGALQVQLVDDRSQRGGRGLELLGFRLVDFNGHLVLDAAGADDRGHGQHDVVQAILAVDVV